MESIIIALPTVGTLLLILLIFCDNSFLKKLGDPISLFTNAPHCPHLIPSSTFFAFVANCCILGVGTHSTVVPGAEGVEPELVVPSCQVYVPSAGLNVPIISVSLP